MKIKFVEVYENDDWMPKLLKELKVGDRYRLYEGKNIVQEGVCEVGAFIENDKWIVK